MTTAHHVEWGYTGSAGPGHWACLSDDYTLCGEGVEQSPVDIARYSPGAAPLITFDYGRSAKVCRNTGHTVYLDFEPGNTISVDDRKYQLLGIHFHSPGEHQLDGETFGAELHLVHQDAEGNLAVVGLLFRSGAPSVPAQAFIDVAPAIGVAVDLRNAVLAAKFVPDQQGYYGYSGSLTTPPCTESVRWIVMQTIGTVSPEQVDRLQDLTNGPNNRPPQPVGQRGITVVAG